MKSTKKPNTFQHEYLLRRQLPWFALTVVLLAISIVVRLVGLETAAKVREQVNALAIDLLAGILISFVFYYLVVFLPEQHRRQFLKNRLLQNYLYIKRSILTSVIIGAIHGGRDDLRNEGIFQARDRLMDVKSFKKEFENGSEANEGYYAFENYMSERTLEFDEILLRISHLKSQVTLALHNFPFAEDNVAGHFHVLEMRLTRLEKSIPGYVSSKPLLDFIFEVFAGWDPVEGYSGKDHILHAFESM